MTETVHWEEDETKTRDVDWYCRRCRGCEQGVYDIVSPGRCAHLAAEFNEGFTACGIDATGKDWWWRT